MSLFRTELRRLAKRRFTRWMTAGGLLVLALIVVGLFFTNQKIGPDQWAEAKRSADQQHQEQMQWAEQERANCERAKAAGENVDYYPADCAEITGPPREAIEEKWFLPSTFVFRESEFEEMLIPLAGILAMVGFVVGASFVGAEWNTGGMMNLLLWRPKRLTVLLTKLGALLTGLLALAVPATAAWFGSLWLVANWRGTTEGVTSGAWQSFLLTGLRGGGAGAGGGDGGLRPGLARPAHRDGARRGGRGSDRRPGRARHPAVHGPGPVRAGLAVAHVRVLLDEEDSHARGLAVLRGHLHR